MALFNFPFQAPAWPKINAVDSTQQSTSHRSASPNSDTNRKCLDTLLTKVAQTDLSGAEQLKAYLCQQYRHNFKTNTMRNAYTGITLFLTFLRHCGKSQLEQITREDLEAFVEHEQDRGLKVSSVYNRISTVQPFIRFLIKNKLLKADVLKASIQLKVPKTLPRAMEPFDVKCLLAVLDDVRNTAMILVLLRTGMRIGELLNTNVSDVHLADKKILIFEGEKNRKGRAVCISNDALKALETWFKKRDPLKQLLFYAQGRQNMSYNNARVIFKKYLARAGLTHKGYSLHCLRHTFATELLNAGMRIECLQQLLGHSNLEMTLRYAKLSDTTREQEYFKAMRIIESEEFHEPDQRNHQLPSPFEASQLLSLYS